MATNRIPPAQASGATPRPAVAAGPRARPRPAAAAAAPAAAKDRRHDASPPSGRKHKAPAAKALGKLVRDSFTMPEADFALIARLKKTAIDAKRAAKKSELLRAGLHALLALDAKALAAALDRLEPVKLGRPKKG
jgi:hypothetical protein